MNLWSILWSIYCCFVFSTTVSRLIDDEVTMSQLKTWSIQAKYDPIYPSKYFSAEDNLGQVFFRKPLKYNLPGRLR